MSNPLLVNVRLPGKVFPLPSKGIFYPPGVLAEHVKDGEIQVHPMSALAEMKIKTADLLISTKIIREICIECVPDVLKPELLLSKDIDALFTFLMVTTYGTEKNIKSIHNCKNADIHDYVVDLNPIISNPNNSSLQYRDALFQTKLDNGQIVKLKPVKFVDAIDMMVLRQKMETNDQGEFKPLSSEETEEIFIRDLLSVIDSVAPSESAPFISDPVMINQWLRAISKSNTELIYQAANKSAQWGFNFTIKLKCKDCGNEYNHDLELNPVNFLSG